jgi:hypothetical protein
MTEADDNLNPRNNYDLYNINTNNKLNDKLFLNTDENEVDNLERVNYLRNIVDKSPSLNLEVNKIYLKYI